MCVTIVPKYCGLAYISTCADLKPESNHFLVLALKTEKYRDLLDCHGSCPLSVLDHQGQAYHPVNGGDIARYGVKSIMWIPCWQFASKLLVASLTR